MDKKVVKLIIFLVIIIVIGLTPIIITSKPKIEKEKVALKTFEYIEVNDETNNIKKPVFKNKMVDNKINEYIVKNKCENLEYNIFNLNDDNNVNIYLNCNNPFSFIYNYKENKIENFENIIQKKEGFQDSVKKLLNLKYPNFVTDEVDIYKGNYNIKSNELIGYYKTVNYGDITIKINNNEVRDSLKYKVTYDDLYENETYKYDPNKKLIAFSFDDGPSQYDLEIIDTLVNSHSKATFFLVGNRINSFKNSVVKMEEKGMEVGNHSYDHRMMTKLSNSKILEEINKTNNLYKQISKKDMKLLRPPYGAINKRVLNLANMPSILWSIDTLDWKTRNADKVYESIIKNAQDGDIVLMHSLYQSTSDAVKKVIPELYKKGFQIVSVGELFELKGKSIIPGNNYTCVR